MEGTFVSITSSAWGCLSHERRIVLYEDGGWRVSCPATRETCSGRGSPRFFSAVVSALCSEQDDAEREAGGAPVESYWTARIVLADTQVGYMTGAVTPLENRSLSQAERLLRSNLQLSLPILTSLNPRLAGSDATPCAGCGQGN